MESSGILPILSVQDGDVLLIFDSCSALPLQITSTGKGVISALSATGFEGGFRGCTPGPGSTSFTNALINVLVEGVNANRSSGENCHPWSDIQIHGALVSRLARQDSSARRHKNGWLSETPGPNSRIATGLMAGTPYYQFLSQNKPPRPIRFRPSTPKTPSSNNPPADSGSKITPQPEQNPPVPHVLLKIQVNDVDFEIYPWVKWIRSCPLASKLVSIEGVYESTSTLQILRLPLDLWDLLPRDPAITFLGFVTSENQAPRINAEISARVSELQAKENPTTPDKRAHVPEEPDDGKVFVEDTPEWADRKGKGVMPPSARTPNGSCLPRLSLTPPDMADRLSPRPTPRRSGSRDSQGHESTGSSSMSSTLARLAIRGKQNKKTSPTGTNKKKR